MYTTGVYVILYVLLMYSFLAVWKVCKVTNSLHSVTVVCIESVQLYTPRALILDNHTCVSAKFGDGFQWI